MIQFQPWSLFTYRISLKCSCDMMSSEELVLNIFFCSAALLSPMYVSDGCLKEPQFPDIAADPQPGRKILCFRLAASSNDLGCLQNEGPHFLSRTSAMH